MIHSLLEQLLKTVPNLLPQTYFKSSLTALSRAIEDLVLVEKETPLVITNWQQGRFGRQDYRQIAQKTDRVYAIDIKTKTETITTDSNALAKIAIDPEDSLAREWILVIVGDNYGACIVCRQKEEGDRGTIDREIRYEGIWAVDLLLSRQAARLLLPKIVTYRPDLAAKVDRDWQLYNLTHESLSQTDIPHKVTDKSQIFAERLLNYLQASQYKLLKASKVIADGERKEIAINRITREIRNSLDPDAVLAVAVAELGQNFRNCRCILYRCRETDASALIEYEYCPQGFNSLQGQIRTLQDNPIIQSALQQDRAVTVNDLKREFKPNRGKKAAKNDNKDQINACLLVAICHQDTVLGMLELHHCESPHQWQKYEVDLVEAIANQIGIALTQAQEYTRSVKLNEQLEVLERSQSNLVAIVGHELRTPLSTIRICLESLESDLDMDRKARREMLEIALGDAERLRQLVQDFLLLSRLESGQEKWQIEPVRFEECLDLAIIKICGRYPRLCEIAIAPDKQVDFISTDAEKLLVVLLKLLDNACKFTPVAGKISISTFKRLISVNGPQQKPILEIIIRDTGKGIEPSQLEAVFDRFYQEENALRRNYGGTGLGLAICRRIVEGLGGKIWAESAGKDKGSSFHFTVAID
jgi:signal transduction histidine kinase/DICT domain-containing protein